MAALEKVPNAAAGQDLVIGMVGIAARHFLQDPIDHAPMQAPMLAPAWSDTFDAHRLQKVSVWPSTVMS